MRYHPEGWRDVEGRGGTGIAHVCTHVHTHARGHTCAHMHWAHMHACTCSYTRKLAQDIEICQTRLEKTHFGDERPSKNRLSERIPDKGS